MIDRAPCGDGGFIWRRVIGSHSHQLLGAALTALRLPGFNRAAKIHYLTQNPQTTAKSHLINAALAPTQTPVPVPRRNLALRVHRLYWQ